MHRAVPCKSPLDNEIVPCYTIMPPYHICIAFLSWRGGLVAIDNEPYRRWYIMTAFLDTLHAHILDIFASPTMRL